MKIQFNGTGAVDVPGADDVQPGEIVELAESVAVSLLAAGSSVDADGVVTPAAHPLWSLPPKPKTETTAAAGKD